MDRVEFTVSTITTFVDIVCQLNNEVQKNFFIAPNELLFRGQADKNYELIPSLGRNRIGACDCTIFNEERNLIDLAKFKMKTWP